MEGFTGIESELKDSSLVQLSKNLLRPEKILKFPFCVFDKELKDQELSLAYYEIAKLYYDKANFIFAEDFFKRALQALKGQKPTYFYLKILGFLIKMSKERFSTEILRDLLSLYQDALLTIRSMTPELDCEYFFNKGVLDNHEGEYYGASENFKIACDLAKKENGPEILVKSIYAHAALCLHLKKFDKALLKLKELGELLEILQKDYIIGNMNLLYGNIYIELQNHNSAIRHFSVAQNIFARKGCWNLQAYNLLGLGVAYKKKGDHATAMIYLDMASNIVDKRVFRRLCLLVQNEISYIKDSDIDIYIDIENRKVYEKEIGLIDFKHRFVLLEILFLLVQNAGKAYDKEELTRLIWDEEYNPLIHDKLIYTSVSRLRKLISPSNKKNKYIIRNKDGYLFNKRIKGRIHRSREDTDLPFLDLGNLEV